MKCIKPYYDKNRKQSFSCGQCLPCRINRTQQWAYRIQCELSNFDYKASFVTFTYNDENLPVNGSLKKDDMQRFFKRLRKDLAPYGRNIKYFMCGEYGDQFGRPHYHAIILGLEPFVDNDRRLIIDNWRLCDDSIWHIKRKRDGTIGKGNAIDFVTPDDIEYVTGYIQKKLTGSMASKEYKGTGRIPPYQCASKGFGLSYAMEHEKTYRYMNCASYKGHMIALPRYYREKLGLAYVNEVKPDVSSFRSDYEDFFRQAEKIMCDKYGPDWITDKQHFAEYERFIENSMDKVLKYHATSFQRRFY